MQVNIELIEQFINKYLYNRIEISTEEFDTFFYDFSENEKKQIVNILEKKQIKIINNEDIIIDDIEDFNPCENDIRENDLGSVFNLEDGDFDEDVGEEESFSCFIPNTIDLDNSELENLLLFSNERLIILYKSTGNRFYRDALLVKNTKLVQKEASKFNRILPRLTFEFNDLVQYGYIGFMKAIERFDLSRGFRLSTYSIWWIRQSISRSIPDEGSIIRVPVHAYEKIIMMLRFNSEFEMNYKRIPNTSEVAYHLDTSEENILLYQIYAQNFMSLDAVVGESSDTTLMELREQYTVPSQVEQANDESLKKDIHKVLNELTERERYIIKKRYGIDYERSYTLEEIGKELNVTRERVRQIEAKALNKIKHSSRRKIFEDYR